MVNDGDERDSQGRQAGLIPPYTPPDLAFGPTKRNFRRAKRNGAEFQ
jgi:hypothetical protein